MSGLFRKLRNLKTVEDLEQVDPATVQITGPTLVYFAGRGEADGNEESISKNLYFVNKIFADDPSPPPVYLWSHDEKYGKKHTGDAVSLVRIAAYSYFGRTSSSAREFAGSIIMPLVTDENGNRLPYPEAAKNLRNLTLLGYCLGTITAQEVHKAALEMMTKEAGYPEQSARDLLREIVLVAFATMSNPVEESDNFTTIFILNSDDHLVTVKNLMLQTLNSALTLGENFFGEQPLTITMLPGNSLLVSAAARGKPLDLIFGGDEVDGVKRPHWNPTENSHSPAAYGLNVSEEEGKLTNPHAGIVAIAVRNALKRTGPVKAMTLLLPPEPATPEEEVTMADRLRRIGAALNRGSKSKKVKLPFGL